jgi:hypothetical protein
MGVVSRPLARSRDLIVEELGDELLVYDLTADRGHCLSPTAALVWRRCDGRTASDGLSAQLDLDPDVVARALDKLAACQLLEATPELDPVPAGARGATRREVATKFVKAGAVAAAAPLIVSVAAPTPAQAQTLGFCQQFNSDPGCGTCSQNDCCCCEPGGGAPKDCVPDTATCCALHEGGNASTGCDPAGPCDTEEGTESSQFETQSQEFTEPAPTEPAPTEPAPTEPAPTPEAPAPAPTTPTTEAPATGSTSPPTTEAAPTP